MKFGNALCVLILFTVAWGLLDYFDAIKIQFYYIAAFVVVGTLIAENISTKHDTYRDLDENG